MKRREQRERSVMKGNSVFNRKKRGLEKGPNRKFLQLGEGDERTLAGRKIIF